jgi:drug/metabolite transporter (DMT)-like permease
VPSATSSRRTKLLVSFAIVYVVWGSTYLVTKIGVGRLPPFSFAAVRFISGGLLLLAVARWLAHRRGERWWPAISGTEWRALGIVGFCAVFVSNGCAVWGLQYVPSNLAALLNVSASFWIPLLGMFGARAQSIPRRIAAGLVAGFAGTTLVAWPGSDATAAVLAWPTLVVLVGCLGWSVGTIHIRNAGISLDLTSFTALQMLCGGVMLLVPATLAGEAHLWQWDAAGLAALGYMTIMSSCIAYTAFAWLSVNVTPAQLSTYGFVNPALALLLGWWVLDERLGPLQLVGTAVILGGTLLINWPGRPPAARGKPAPAASLSNAEREAPPAA